MVPVWTAVASRDEFGGSRPLLSMSAVHGVRLRQEGEGRAASDDVSGYRVVRPGDLVVNRLSARDGGYGVSALEGLVSPAYWVFKTSRNQFEPRWIDYVLRSLPYQAELRRISKFMPPAQFDLPWDQFRRLPLPMPSLAEQRAIADFLDAETARIDALIAKKRRLIELLGEQFGAAVNSMTDGPSVPLRRAVGRFVDYRGATPEKAEAGVPLVTAAHVKSGSIDLTLDPQFLDPGVYEEWMQRGWPEVGDVVMTTEAPLGEVAWITDARVALAQRVILMKVDSLRADATYLGYALRSPRFRAVCRAFATGSTALGIKADRLKGLPVCCPPVAVQRSVARRMVDLEGLHRAIVGRLTKQLDLLAEHRRALITAAVTGELAVPGAAA